MTHNTNICFRWVSILRHLKTFSATSWWIMIFANLLKEWFWIQFSYSRIRGWIWIIWGKVLKTEKEEIMRGGDTRSGKAKNGERNKHKKRKEWTENEDRIRMVLNLHEARLIWREWRNKWTKKKKEMNRKWRQNVAVFNLQDTQTMVKEINKEKARKKQTETEDRMRAVINLQRRTIDTQRMVKEINKEKETNRQKVKTECGRYLTWKDEQ